MPDEDPWFRPATASRDYLDAPRPERDPLYRGMLGGITNWPDDGLTLPGVVTPPAVVDLLGRVPPGAVPAHMRGALESGPHNDSLGASTGEKAVDNAIKEPPEAIAGAPSSATESAEDKGNADVGDGPSALGTEEPADHRVTLRHRISAVLGTTRGKWAVAAIGATIVLSALGVVLAVHSHQIPAAAVQQAGDDSPVATGPAASYPAPPPYAHTTPSDPARDTTAPRPYDSDPAATAPSPGAPLHGMSPNDPVPPGLPSDDPLTPSAPMPLDPAASDPGLDQTQPVGPDQTQVSPTQGRNGLASPQGRPDDRATTPRNPSPLSNSLNSITAPHRPGNSDRGESDSQGPSKSVGGDLSGLGRGL